MDVIETLRGEGWTCDPISDTAMEYGCTNPAGDRFLVTIEEVDA